MRSLLHSLPVLLILILLIVEATERTEECCKKRGVTPRCAKALCNAETVPGDMERYTLFQSETNCTDFLGDVAFCLADGRDHFACCKKNSAFEEKASCFTLCKGFYPTQSKSQWHNYQECLALNLDSIFGCFVSGAKDTPTMPVEFHVSNRTLQTITFDWKAPESNANLVSNYEIKMRDNGATRPLVKTFTTTATTFTVDDLFPNTHYTVYALAMTADPDKKSLHSSIINFDTFDGQSSVATLLSSGRAQVSMPKSAQKFTIACRLRIYLEQQASPPSSLNCQCFPSKVRIEWERKESSSFKPLTGDRYVVNFYQSPDQASVWLSALVIYSIDPSTDYGLYRCINRGVGGETAEVEIQPTPKLEVPSSPPGLVSDCCKAAQLKPECADVCNRNDDVSYGFAPESVLLMASCYAEIWTLLQCSMVALKSASCCVRQEIPYYCLSLCETGIVQGQIRPGPCIMYLSKITNCHQQGFDVRPGIINDLQVEGDDSSVTLKWEEPADVDTYHVYHKAKSSSTWNSQSLPPKSTSVTLSDAANIVIYGVNDFGFGTPIRANYDGSGWKMSMD